jgi:hypothetical protein
VNVKSLSTHAQNFTLVTKKQQNQFIRNAMTSWNKIQERIEGIDMFSDKRKETSNTPQNEDRNRRKTIDWAQPRVINKEEVIYKRQFALI